MNDSDFYEQIANMMEDRKCGNQFARDLSVSATVICNNLYIEHLQNLRSFLQ